MKTVSNHLDRQCRKREDRKGERTRESEGEGGKGTVTIAIIPQRFLENGEVSPLVSACDSAHAFYVLYIGIF